MFNKNYETYLTLHFYSFLYNFNFSLNSKVKNGKLYMATFAAVLGPLSFGFVLGYSSPAIPELCRIQDSRLQLSKDEASWFGVCECFWSGFTSKCEFFIFIFFYQLQFGRTIKEMLVIFSSQNLHYYCNVRAGGFKREPKSKCSCQCINI